MNYADAGKAIKELALGLVDLGVEPGDRVCILANTRIEWVIAMYAISAAGAIVVPDLPDQLAQGVPVGGRELGGRGASSARTRGSARRSSRSAMSSMTSST